MELTKEDYVARIRNATPLQLIIITFELSIVNLEDAKNTSNKEDFENHIRKSQDFLMQLMTSLDMTYNVSNNLLNVYLYVNKLLHEAFFTKSKETLSECIELLNNLLESFEIIAKDDDTKEPIMNVSQQIYAGLTYKNGNLSEMIVEDLNNGYRA